MVNCTVCASPLTPDKPWAACGEDCQSAIYCGAACADHDWYNLGHMYECEPVERAARGQHPSKWISKMHLRKGALKRKAKARHESLSEYEHDVESGKIHASTRTKRQVNLARTFSKMNRNK